MLTFQRGVATSVGQQYGGGLGAQFVLRADKNRCGETALQIGGDQADSAGGAAGQGLGEFVGGVVELLGGIQNALLGFFANAGLVVQCLGCGGQRDPSQCRHILKSRCPSGCWLGHHASIPWFFSSI